MYGAGIPACSVLTTPRSAYAFPPNHPVHAKRGCSAPVLSRLSRTVPPVCDGAGALLTRGHVDRSYLLPKYAGTQCIASTGFFLMTPTHNSHYPGKKRKLLLSNIA